MSSSTVVDVVISGTTATVVDTRVNGITTVEGTPQVTNVSGQIPDLGVTTSYLAGQGEILSLINDVANLRANVIITGQTLTDEIGVLSGVLISTGNYLESNILTLSGNLIASGNNLDSLRDILSGNLITTGQTLTTDINTVSANLISTGKAVDDISGNLINTGQTLQTQITSNDSDIATLDSTTVKLTTNQSIAGNKIFSDRVTINNLHVTGTEVIVDVENLAVKDNLIHINSGESGAGISRISGGITIDRGTEASANILYNDASDRFEFNFPLALEGNLAVTANQTGVYASAANLITTGQNLQVQIASNDSDIQNILTDIYYVSNNLVTTGQTLTSEIAIVSGLTTGSSSDPDLSGKVDTLSGNLITTGQTLLNHVADVNQTLQTQITSNDSDLADLTDNLVTTGQTIATDISAVYATLVSTGAIVDDISGNLITTGHAIDLNTLKVGISTTQISAITDNTANLITTGQTLTSEIIIVSGIAGGQDLNTLSGNLITTGQTLQTQITSNDGDITTLTSNLITTGQTLTSEIAIVSGIATGSSAEDFAALSGDLITTGQTLQTQITSNDSDISTLTSNLITTGQTLTTSIDTVSSNLVSTGAIVDDISGNLITTGQTLQTQITSNDGDISTLTSNLITTGQTLTTDIDSKINTVTANLISTGQTLTSELAIVSGIATGGSAEEFAGLSGNLITTGQTLQTQITSNDSDISTLTSNLVTTGQTLTTNVNTVASNLVSTGTVVDDISGNLITTGQTLQTQITSNDTDITNLTSNLVTTGQTLTTDINTVSSNLVSTGSVVDDISGNLITTGQTLQTQITSNDGDITSLTSNLTTTGQTLQTQITSNDGDIATLDSTTVKITTNQSVAGNKIFTDTVTINNLTVTGTEVIVDVENLAVRDNIIHINSGESGAGISRISGGITIDRGTDPAANILYNDANDRFELNFPLATEGNVVASATNLITTGQTLTTNINTVSTNLVSTGAIVDDVSGNLITTGQTLQTQITSNDTDITNLISNLVTTGQTLTSEIATVSGLIPATVVDGSGTANYVSKWTDANTIGNSQISDDGTKVGIGVAGITSFKLNVGGAINASGSVLVNNNSYFGSYDTVGSYIPLLSLSTSNDAFLGGTSLAYAGYPMRVQAKYITFEPAGTIGLGVETMRITNSTFNSKGSVGIGTNVPSSLLHVYSDANSYLEYDQELYLQTANNTTAAFTIKGTGTADLVNIFDGTTEVFTILDGGSVGIGTSVPLTLLHILSTTPYPSDGTGAIRLAAADASSDSKLEFYQSTTSKGAVGYDDGNDTIALVHDTVLNSTKGINIKSDGNVGIGTTNPGYLLDVNGTANIGGALTGTSATFSGNVLITSGGFFSIQREITAVAASASYTSGTATQSGTVVTGYSTSFTADMVGKYFYFTSGGSGSSGTITNFINSGLIQVSESKTVSTQHFFSVDTFVSSFKQLNSTGGTSYGVNVIGGTSASDISFRVANQADSSAFIIKGDKTATTNNLEPIMGNDSGYLGSSSKKWKQVYFGILEADTAKISGLSNLNGMQYFVTMDSSGNLRKDSRTFLELTGGTLTGALTGTTATFTTVTAALVGNATTSTNTTGNAATVTTNANLTGDVTSVGNATSLTNTTVTAASYTYASITVDAKGRLTAASSGSAPGGGTVTGTGTANYISKWTGTNSQGNSSIYEAGAGGKIGIGTSVPLTLLHILSTTPYPSDGTGAIRLAAADASSDSKLEFYQSTTSKGAVGYDDGNDTIALVHDTVLNSTKGINIKSDGNVGIGTIGPLCKLDIRTTSTSLIDAGATVNIEEDAAWTQGLALYMNNADAYNADYASACIGVANNGSNIIITAGAKVVNNPGVTQAYKTLNSTTPSVYRQSSGAHIFYGDTAKQVDMLYTPTERMRIDYDGNVGIGTTAPSSLLTLQSSVGGAVDIFAIKADDGGNLYRVGKDANDHGYIELFDGASTPIKVRLNSSGSSYFNGGSVGIGTATPDQTFQVRVAANQNLRVRADSTAVQINARNDANSADVPFYLRGSLFNFQVGKVGIGTAAPSNALDVQAGTTNTAIVARSTDAKAQISLVDNSTTSVGSVVIGAEGDDLFLAAGSGGAEALRIKSDGKVGIGTDAPLARLHVSTSRYSTNIVSGYNFSSGWSFANASATTSTKITIGGSGTFGKWSRLASAPYGLYPLTQGATYKVRLQGVMTKAGQGYPNFYLKGKSASGEAYWGTVISLANTVGSVSNGTGNISPDYSSGNFDVTFTFLKDGPAQGGNYDGFQFHAQNATAGDTIQIDTWTVQQDNLSAGVSTLGDDLVVSGNTGTGISVIGEAGQEQNLLFGDGVNNSFSKICAVRDTGSEDSNIYFKASENDILSTAMTVYGYGTSVGISSTLYVGKTSTNFMSAGIELHNAPPAWSARIVATGTGPLANFNRLASDGTIIMIQSGSGLRGTIGTFSNGITIGTGAAAFSFDTSASIPAISSWNVTTNAATTSTVDLGTNSNKWRDIHLSGNVNAGGAIFRGNLSMANAGGVVAYTFPNADGASGYTLQTNGAGTVTWAAAGGGGGGGSGTVTSVATGTGLTGGPITSTGTISIAGTFISSLPALP